MDKRLVKFCKDNNIWVYFSSEKYIVECQGAMLYQSDSYIECVDYLSEMMLFDKHTNNR